MKLLTNMKLLLIGLLTLSPAICFGTTAADLSATCQKTINAVTEKGKFDGKRPDDIYAAGQCEGFIEGWLEGVDQSVYTVGNQAYVVSIKWSQLPKSMFTIADALAKYLKDNPLESGKPADIILVSVLRGSQLLSATPYIVNNSSTQVTSTQ